MEMESWNTERDGPFSEAAFRLKIEALGFNETRYVYPPGTYFPRHIHAVDKMDAVVSGQFRIISDGKGKPRAKA